MGIPDQSKWLGVAPTDPPQSIPATVDFEHVDNNQSFIRALGLAPLAGNYNHAQLWNPAASGVIVYLTKAHINSNAGAAVRGYRLSSYSTALAILAGAGYNKRLDGAEAKALLRYEQAAGFLGTFIDYIFQNNYYTTEDWNFNPPIRLDEGKGIIITIGQVNINVSAGFEWIEI